MKFLITGATGLVGSEISKICRNKGITVHYLTTSANKIENTKFKKGFLWNPSKGEIDITAFEGVSKIIHLAGATVAKKWTADYKKEILDSRIYTTKLLFDSLYKIKHSVNQIVSASAIGIYPSSFTTYYMESNEEKSNEFLGEVVQKWEKEVEAFSALNVKVSKVRIGLVLSNKGGALPQMTAPVKFGAGSAFGSGKQWQSWIHIEDLAQMFLFITEQNLKGTFNGVAPDAVSQNKLIKQIGKTINRPTFLPNIPSFMLNLMFGEMGSILLESQRVCSGKIREHNFEFKYPKIEIALNDLLNN